MLPCVSKISSNWFLWVEMLTNFFGCNIQGKAIRKRIAEQEEGVILQFYFCKASWLSSENVRPVTPVRQIDIGLNAIIAELIKYLIKTEQMVLNFLSCSLAKFIPFSSELRNQYFFPFSRSLKFFRLRNTRWKGEATPCDIIMNVHNISVETITQAAV